MLNIPIQAVVIDERVLAEIRSALFAPGNPFSEELLTGGSVDTWQTIAINPALGRNAHRGFIKSASINPSTSIISIEFSHNGVSFSKAFEDLRPDQSISLDGMDIHSIRVRSNLANDQFHVMAW